MKPQEQQDEEHDAQGSCQVFCRLGSGCISLSQGKRGAGQAAAGPLQPGRAG